MPTHTYAAPPGGLPPQTARAVDRAVFTNAYALIPRDTMRDIVTSQLPFWNGMRAWVLARPMSGFSETFSHYLVELEPDGGADRPEDNPDAEAVLFVTSGAIRLSIGDNVHELGPGGYAYVPAGADWRVRASGPAASVFHWIRKRYQRVEGVEPPGAFVATDAGTPPVPMPGTEGRWATTRFVDPTDMRHDMHVNIVTLAPGASIPFSETHVMEHGLFILQGKGLYQLNRDWVEVEAGDFLWLRAFCPQSCLAGGEEPFRYLLYKDVNRHMPLFAPGPAR